MELSMVEEDLEVLEVTLLVQAEDGLQFNEL
jgi:hypothetical protein